MKAALVIGSIFIATHLGWTMHASRAQERLVQMIQAPPVKAPVVVVPPIPPPPSFEPPGHSPGLDSHDDGTAFPPKNLIPPPNLGSSLPVPAQPVPQPEQ